MRKTPTLKNILHSQYGSTVLSEYYCSWVGPIIYSQAKTKHCLKVFWLKSFGFSQIQTEKNTINLLKLLCIQDTKSKHNFENQNWLSRVSIYELSTIIFTVLFFLENTLKHNSGGGI